MAPTAAPSNSKMASILISTENAVINQILMRGYDGPHSNRRSHDGVVSLRPAASCNHAPEEGPMRGAGTRYCG